MPDALELDEEETNQQDARDRDAERKQGIADYADKRNRPSQLKELNTGDLVLLEKRKENKLSPAYEEEPYQITTRYGDQLHLQSPQGVTYKRNVGHVKRYHQPSQTSTVRVPFELLMEEGEDQDKATELSCKEEVQKEPSMPQTENVEDTAVLGGSQGE